jgi:hypothetical protein
MPGKVRSARARRAAGVILAAAFVTTAGAGGPRLVVEVDEPFLLQGQLVPAGEVSLRLVSRYNPTSTLHAVDVDGTCLGVFRAESWSSAAGDRRDTIRFERDARGRLVLTGYTLRRGRSADFYRFSDPPSASPDLQAAAGAFGKACPSTG